MIRPLALSALDAFVALRTASFASDPLSWDHEAGSIVDPEVWADRIVEIPDEQFVLGYFLEDGDTPTLVGMLGFQRYAKKKRKHRAMIWGVYVSPAARGRGVSRSLLKECIARACKVEGLDRLILTVSSHAEAACRLYRSEGFTEYGREPDAARTDGVSMDEVYMMLNLADVAPGS